MPITGFDSPDEKCPVRWVKSLRRVLHFALLLTVSWCVMTFTHESGHVLAGWAGGGTLRHADLAPWRLPHSSFDPDPRPLVTLWGGPVLGVLVPLTVGLLVRRDWVWFVAHFCLLANGSYHAAAWASGEQYLDTARLLQHGAHPATIAAYCVLTIGAGYVGFRRQCIRVLSAGPGERALDGRRPGLDHAGVGRGTSPGGSGQ